jgi:hypothetical protein
MFRGSTAVVTAALLVTGCDWLVTSLAAERRDWMFVQSVGGMALGTPYRTASGVMLPISVDVSGAKKITVEPRVINSALALKEVVVRREGHTLCIELITTVGSKSDWRTSSSDVALGDLDPGQYAVVYVEPSGARVAMGEIILAQ